MIELAEKDGWAAIASALEGARAGDSVVLGAGRYEGASTLTVPAGVTLAGEVGTLLAFTGEDAAILVEDAEQVVLRDFDMEDVGFFPRSFEEGDVAGATGASLIRVVRAPRFEIAKVRIRALARRSNGLAIVSSDNVVVSSVEATGAAGGISLFGSSGRVEACVSHHNWFGLVLARTDTGERSVATLRLNTCHENGGPGIGLFSSQAEDLSANTCWGNKYGIVLAPDERQSDAPAPARARICDNVCHENAHAGIILSSSESDEISGNTCWGNDAGIVLGRDARNPGVKSFARISANICRNNVGAGIELWSSEGVQISKNLCSANGLSGIVLRRAELSPDEPSRASLTSNRCHENGNAGIVLLSSVGEEISDNTCWANGLDGIALDRDQLSPSAPSRAPLTANTCYNNKRAGITLYSAQSDAVSGNSCSGNGDGIVLQRAELSVGAPSEAPILGNTCRDNEHCGIVLLSSESEGVSNNICHGNQAGIALSRGDKSLNAPARARLISNSCNQNKEVGIFLVSSESDEISGNECSENGLTGIELRRANTTPDAPSFAKLIRLNICNDNNEGTGLALFSSLSEEVSENTCVGNKHYGIALRRDVASAASPSRARIRANVCRDNALIGIILVSAESEAVSENRCQGNGIGISIQRDPASPEAPSRARIKANLCWENAEVGILLLSSESEEIAKNTVWGNGEGIVLQRSDIAPEAASRAQITENTVHDNQLAGIALCSSESDDVRANACWRNNEGIVLQRDERSLSAPSRARIRENLCHENKASGIALFSSESDAVCANTSWGNKDGILLQRDRKTPDLPSRAPITNNSCYQNEMVGIVLVSCESEVISGNRCWRNEGGIVLQRGASPGTPACAPLLMNVCYENAKFGICLMSSESESISGNACWGNGWTGIGLQRDPLSADQPSHAAIRTNTCCENGQFGIALFGSESDDLAGNICWGNGFGGIALQPDEKAVEAPPRARISANWCHDNKQDGIVVYSSTCEAVTENRCWRNGTGLSVRRDVRSPDLPSRGSITENYCHDNDLDGVSVYSSMFSAISDNACWGNSSSGIYISGNDAAPAAVDEVARNRLQGNVVGVVADDAVATIRGNFLKDNHVNRETPSAHSPTSENGAAASIVLPADRSDALTRELQLSLGALVNNEVCPSLNLPADCDDGLMRHLRGAFKGNAPDSLPTELASFLTCGATSGFEALVAAVRPGVESPALEETGATNAIWRVDWTDNGLKVGPLTREGGVLALTRRLAHLASAVVAKYEARVFWSAFVAPDEASLDDLKQGLSSVVQAHNDARASNDPGRVAPVIVVDRSDRRRFDEPSHGAGSDLFEREALGGDGKWGQRIDCLMRSWAVWLALAACGLLWFIAGGVALPEWPTDGLAQIRLAVAAGLAIVVSLSAITALANAALPAILEVRLPGWTAVFDRLVDAGFLSRKNPSKLFSAGWIARMNRRVSVAWVRRRLFRDGDILPLVIRHVEAWSDEELLRLRELAGGVKSSQGLFVVLQLDDRAYLRPAVLNVAVGLRPWTQGLELHFDDDRERVSISATPHEGAADLERLIGAGDAAVATRVKAAIRHTRWTSLELNAVLPLGSAPTGRFSIRRSVARLAEHDDQLREDMGVIASFFTSEQQPAPNQETLNLLFDLGAKSSALGYAADHDVERVWGKVGRRRQVAQLIRDLFPVDQSGEADAYLAGAVASGIWRILGDVTEALKRLETRSNAEARELLVGIAVRGLEAVAFLGAELEALRKSAAHVNLAALEPRWLSLAAAMEINQSVADGAAIARSYLAALTATGRDPPVDYVGWDAASILSKVDASVAPSLDQVTPLAGLSIELSGTIQRLQNMDQRTAVDAMDRLVRQAWRGLPADLVDGLRARCAAGRSITLAARMAAADTIVELERVVRLHARRPLVVVHMLGVLAAQCAWTAKERVQDANARPDEEMTRVATFLRGVISSDAINFEQVDTVTLPVAGLSVSSLSLNLHAILGLGLHLKRGAGVADLMKLPTPETVVSQWLTIDPPSPPIDGVIDLELERVLALAQKH